MSTARLAVAPIARSKISGIRSRQGQGPPGRADCKQQLPTSRNGEGQHSRCATDPHLASSRCTSFLLRPQTTTSWHAAPTRAAMALTVASIAPMPSPPPAKRPTSSQASRLGLQIYASAYQRSAIRRHLKLLHWADLKMQGCIQEATNWSGIESTPLAYTGSIPRCL